MKFWAVNVKCGETVDVMVPEGQQVHMGQAILGELINGSNDTVDLLITVNGEQRVLGTLHHRRFPQHTFSTCIIEENFHISHTSKDCSVNLFGYTALKYNIAHLNNQTHQDTDDFYDDEEDRDEEEEEEIPKMQSGKKRPNESASKTPNTRKKTKSTTTPQRTGKAKKAVVSGKKKKKAAGKQKVKIVIG